MSTGLGTDGTYSAAEFTLLDQGILDGKDVLLLINIIPKCSENERKCCT